MKNFWIILTLVFATITSASAQRYLKTFDTLTQALASDLRDIHTNFWTKGRTSVTDGGGGQFWYEPTATTATNRGMVFAHTKGGRIFRTWDTEILPQWFGANDSGGADAATELQEAIDFASRPTYGWQGFAGENSGTNALSTTGYNGTFRVRAIGVYALYSTVYIRDGALVVGKTGGSTGDFGGNTMFLIRHGGVGFVIDLYRPSNGYRIGGIRDCVFSASTHTYQPNKKAINTVVDRYTFKVADADAPPTLDDTTLRQANNTCFFYDPNGEYLGSARIQSTSSSAGLTTVNLFQNGTDAFSSINGTAGGALTTACKVVWPVRVTDEYTSVGAFNDPSLAGPVAISIKNTSSATVTGTPILDNLQAWGFHAGFRIGPGILWGGSPIKDLRSQRHKFAGFAIPRPDNMTDLVVSGGQLFQGYYAIDFAQTLPQGASVTVSATSPAVFTKVGHGYAAGTMLRFGATGSMPGGITSGTTYPATPYYVQSTGLTVDTFQVSTSFQGGTSVNASSTGSGVYIAGNAIDQPALQYGTYGIWNAPTLARFDTVVAEFSGYANVYANRIIAPHFKYLFCDGTLRHGLVLGNGYNQFVTPTSSAFANWVTVDNFVVKPGLPGSPYDTRHTNSVAVFFEQALDTTRFAGVSINQFSAIRAQTGGPQFTHAFDLQPAAYNNRAKVGMIVENNGYAAWRNPTGTAPEVDAPNLTQAADVDTGWYRPSATQRDFAVSGTRLISLTSGNVLVEKAGGASLFTLKNTTSSTTATTTVGTENFSVDDANASRRYFTALSSSTDVGLILGSSGNTGAARGTQITGELMSGTDKSAGQWFFYSPRGTGAGTSGGFQFYTGDTGTSGTTLHTLTRKFYVPAQGGVRVEPLAAAPSAIGSGHLYFDSTTRNFRFWDGSYYQPFSTQADEVTVASASTVNLGFQLADKVYITGTTGITSFGAALGGTWRDVRFEGSLTLTYNATSMILPGGRDIVTKAGDTLRAVCISTGNWRVTQYTRASVSPVATDVRRVRLASDVVNSNASANTIADVTGLSFAVVSGRTYKFNFFVVYTSAATTTGSRWAVNGPTTTLLEVNSRYSLDASTETVNNVQAYDTPAAANASSLTAGNYAKIEGVIIPSANGTLIVRFASEVSSSAITAKAGSYGEIIDITDL